MFFDERRAPKGHGMLSKNMTTVVLSMRYIFRAASGEYGLGAKAIERGSEEALARCADAAKRARATPLDKHTFAFNNANVCKQ